MLANQDEAVKAQPLLTWLLRQYCRENRIDSHEIDSHLTFNENMSNLEKQFGKLETPSFYRRKQR